MALGAYIPVVQ